MDFSKLKKIESQKDKYSSFDENDVLEMIIKVKKANYHPQKVEVRTQISDLIFTANVKVKDVKFLESDELVETFSTSKPLGTY